MDEDMLLFFNGINAATGEYLLPEMDPATLSKVIQGLPVDESTNRELSLWYDHLTQGNYGLKEGLDPKKLEESGWGIVFSHDESEAVIQALKPLIEWRQSQAAAKTEKYFQNYAKAEGYRPNDSKNGWLARHGAGPGPADPENVPYYLLLVGSPEKIPYRFQTQLDVQYGVGRIYFDTVEEYANYAKSVVEAEKQQLKLARKLAFFGAANPDDRATELSAAQLVAPLMQSLMDNPELAGWGCTAALKDQATKARLGRFLGGADTPALLFTASHGMGFPNGHPLQLRHNGALMTQDWPGPRQWKKEIKEDFYFSADDLSADLKLWGLISFFFACYGAGTPDVDEFAQQMFKKKRGQIAPKPFISRLPQKMLSHPKGGALAVLGHVERAWGYSFIWGKAGRQLAVFESTLRRLMEGFPVGWATEYFNQRYAELATTLADELEEVSFGKTADDLELSGMWTAHNDARNYVVLGDPAVRMMVAESGDASPSARPVIELPVMKEVKVNYGAGEPPVTAEDVPAQAEPETAVVKGTLAAGNGGSLPAEPETASLSRDIVTSAPVDYSVWSDAGDSLRKLGTRIGEFLTQAINDAVTLRIETYVAKDEGSWEINRNSNMVSGAVLRAVTVVQLNGNITQVVPVNEDNELDAVLWNMHLQTVEQAEKARAEMIKSAIEAATSLLGLGK